MQAFGARDRQDLCERDRVLVHHEEPGAGGEPPAQARLAARAHHHDRSVAQRGMARVDIAGSGEEDETRMFGEAEVGSKLAPGRRGLGEDPLGIPEMRARLAKGARSHEHAVRAGAQEPHHEAVAVIVAADDPARFGSLRERDDSVHRGDEIGEDPGPLEPEVPSVSGAERGRERKSARVFRLVQ